MQLLQVEDDHHGECVVSHSAGVASEFLQLGPVAYVVHQGLYAGINVAQQLNQMRVLQSQSTTR